MNCIYKLFFALLVAPLVLTACSATDVKYRKADELAQVKEVCVADTYQKTGVDVAKALVDSFQKQGVKARLVDSPRAKGCPVVVNGKVRMAAQGLIRQGKFSLMTFAETGNSTTWSSAVYMLRGEEKANSAEGGLSAQTDKVVSLLLNKQAK